MSGPNHHHDQRRAPTGAPLLIIDLDQVDNPDPKAKYAATFATTLDDPLWIQADLYAWRQDHELAFRDCIHALGLDAKSKGYLKDLPDPASSWTLLTAARKLIRRTGLLQIQGNCLWVIFVPFPGNEVLAPYCQWVNAADFTIPSQAALDRC